MIIALQQSKAAEGAGNGALGRIFGETPWIDLVGMGVVVLFIGLGIRRGLVWQVTRLIGMLVAVTLARSLSPEFVPQFEEVLQLPTKACQGIVWFLIFMGTLIVTSIIGMVGRRALEAVHLGAMDRAGGGLAGAVTGVIVHCVLLVMLTALGTPEWAAHTLRGSASANMLDSLSRKQHLLLDAQAAEKIMEPWVHTYDPERHERVQRELEEEQEERMERAKELKRQYEEEMRRAQEGSQAPGIR